MATIGDTSSYGMDLRLGNSIGHRSNLYQYPAVANDHVTSISVYGRSGSGSSTVEVAIYSVNVDRPFQRLGSTYTITFTSSVVSWQTVNIAAPALVAGKKYCVAIGKPSANFAARCGFDISNSVSLHQNTALESLWVERTFRGWEISMFATVQNIIPRSPVTYPCCAQLIQT